MANFFKSSVFDGSTIAANTAMSVFTANSTSQVVGLSMMLTNVDTVQIEVDAELRKSGANNVYLAFNWPVPAGGSIEAIEGKLVLESGDEIVTYSDTANSLHTTFSYLAIT